MYEFKQSVDGVNTNWLLSLQKVPQNEVQTLSITGTPTGGHFTLTYSGQTTGNIAYNASHSDVQTALEALSNIAVGDVVCAGGALPGTAVTITFEGTLANTDVSAITATASLTGGTTPATAIAETTKGGNTVYAYVAKPQDTTWTKVTGATFDVDSNAHYSQIADKILILSGKDKLCYFDITTVSATPTITTYDAIDDVGQPTIANDGSTTIIDDTTNPYTVYYAVTANSTIGQSTGTYKSQAIDLERSQWDKTKNGLSITWTKVTGAQSYNIYAATQADGDGTPSLYLLAGELSADNNVWVDDGSLPLQTNNPMPTANGTDGPTVKYATVINGRVWAWGDTDSLYKIYYGGNYLHELDFSTAYGSGWFILGNGTTEVPSVVWNFRSGQGDPEIKVLTKGLNGSGKRYTVKPQTISLGDQSTTFWQASEDYGFTGTEGPDSLIVYGDSTYYPSRDGFKTTGTKPQLQNLLSTDGVSDTIIDTLGQINWSAMESCIGLGFEDRLYWCLPVGKDTNSQVWVLDLQRKGAWMLPWTIEATDMLLIEDNDGVTHHCVVQNNTLYELSYATHCNDDGTPFTTSGATGLNYFSKDGRDWARVIRLVAEVLRLQGTLDMTVYGYTNKKKLVPVGTGHIEATTETEGFGWSENGWSTYGWSVFNDVPAETTLASQDLPIKIGKDLRYWSLTWSTTGANTDYAMSKFVTEQVNVGIKNLT
jgi:hypothetical protein